MSVGLYDVDFFKYHQVMFNLEIMKMATYFKKKREITVLSPTLSPERYSKFYLRKDFNDGIFPNGLHRFPNLDYGGFAFSGNVYVPVMEEIEICQPDVFIYDKYKPLFTAGAKTHESAYTSLTNNIHLRLSLNEKEVWNNFEKQITPNNKANICFFHDFDLGRIKDSPEAVKYILEKYSKKKDAAALLGVKFPIHCQTLNDFQTWNSFASTENFFTLQVDNVLEDEEFFEVINSLTRARAEKIKYKIASSSSDKNHFIKVILPKIFKQVIFCCNTHKQISLIIDDDFFIEKEWVDVITLLNLFLSASTKYTRVPALYRFCKSLKEKNSLYKNSVMCKEEARELFLFVNKNHPELFELFYECNKVELENGGFKVVKSWA